MKIKGNSVEGRRQNLTWSGEVKIYRCHEASSVLVFHGPAYTEADHQAYTQQIFHLKLSTIFVIRSKIKIKNKINLLIFEIIIEISDVLF